MQPYFFAYIGYFQLIASVDEFILYDNIKYTKKGWINRNRMLLNGKDATFSLPLRGDSDSFAIFNRELSVSFDRNKLLNQFRGAYHRAPYFKSTFLLLEDIIFNKEVNLFEYIYTSIVKVCSYLGIETQIKVSSKISVDHELKNQQKVLALCNSVGASTYVNAIGGIDLYSKGNFLERGVDLKFIKSQPFEYHQFDNEFVPWLSIIDVMMFNSPELIQDYLVNGYELI